MRQLVPLTMWMLVACSASHGATDGAVPEDGGCVGDDPGCALIDGHVCGDAFIPAVCDDGAWRCPSGTTPAAEAECWCYGGERAGCACTPSGWSCADAGVVDAGACPSDPSAEGTPCADEGRFCGSCADPCGFCNILRCEGGEWTRLEAPPPPGPCVSFECGPELRCDAVTQYCEHVTSDVGGEPDSYRCAAYPEGCSSCSCLPGNECTGDAETGIQVTWYGG